MVSSMKLPLVDGEEQSSYDPMGEKLKMMSGKLFFGGAASSGVGVGVGR